jgi:hypothetical protein
LEPSGEKLDKPFLCKACARPVKPLAKGGTSPAHFEHLKRNLDCPLSDKQTAKKLYKKHHEDKAAKAAK